MAFQVVEIVQGFEAGVKGPNVRGNGFTTGSVADRRHVQAELAVCILSETRRAGAEEYIDRRDVAVDPLAFIDPDGVFNPTGDALRAPAAGAPPACALSR
jgi:hypothetical protein